MTKGGLAAVRERIRQAFVNQVHGDVRDEAQVRASQEMLAEITEPPAQAEQNNLRKKENSCGEHDERTFHARSKGLAHAALLSVHINSQRMLPRGVHQCYVVEAPSESANELFEQALKQLGCK
jgi:hypothetical protein